MLPWRAAACPPFGAPPPWPARRGGLHTSGRRRKKFWKILARSSARHTRHGFRIGRATRGVHHQMPPDAHNRLLSVLGMKMGRSGLEISSCLRRPYRSPAPACACHDAALRQPPPSMASPRSACLWERPSPSSSRHSTGRSSSEVHAVAVCERPVAQLSQPDDRSAWIHPRERSPSVSGQLGLQDSGNSAPKPPTRVRPGPDKVRHVYRHRAAHRATAHQSLTS